ncbi:MAG: VOC family protein [Burkholderiales bacterium]|nr:VOC family protein [Burkholderiales bacterium]
MSTKPGSFVWYELMTSDSEAAAAFYRTVTGWEIRDSGMPGHAYSLLYAGGAMVGGLMTTPPEARAAGVPPCWTGYIGVDDVDACAVRIQAAGGSVLRAAEDIPGIGRFAVAADPHGAAFIVFKSMEDEPGPELAPDAAGNVGWRELYAGDGASAFAFYAGLFGWTKAREFDMGALGIYQLFATGGADPVGGMMTRTPDTPAPFWLYYFNVDGIDAAVERIGTAGGSVVMGAHQVPTGQWIAQCADPQGAYFALLSSTR